MLNVLTASLALLSGPLGLPQDPLVRFLSLEEGRVAIVDEGIEPYHSLLRAREVELMSGVPLPDELLARGLGAVREEGRRRWAADVRAFEPEERAAIHEAVVELAGVLGQEFPSLAELPWTFLKVRAGHCAGMPHTRGAAIVFDEEVAKAFVSGRRGQLLGLLAHEQMHVYQRAFPERMRRFYERDFGLLHAPPIEGHAWLDLRQVTNPDGVRLEWVLRDGTGEGARYFWPRTVLDPAGGAVPGRRPSFQALAVELDRLDDGSFRVRCGEDGSPLRSPLAELPAYRRAFPEGFAHDHPNEVSAYLLEALVGERPGPPASPPELRDRFRLLLGAAPGRLLELHAPVDRWDEGIPLGNGLLGGLLWGSGSTIHLSLDRGDLWDERLPEVFHQAGWTYAAIQELVAAGDAAELVRRFDAPYEQVPYPTKLPGGRLVLELEEGLEARTFWLDSARGVGGVDFDRAQGAETVSLSALVHAQQPVGLVRTPGRLKKVSITRPAGLDRLGYRPADAGTMQVGDRGVVFLKQEAAEGLSYAICASWEARGADTLLAWSIATNREGEDPLGVAGARVQAALDAGFEAALEPHLDWWRRFWATSSVSLPDPDLQRHYRLVKYFYGAASRRGAPPMPLQGVWTADEGGLPPWKGDFHHDLNTQMSYLAYHAAGLREAGLSFLDRQWELLPAYRDFARSFYDVGGAVVPGVATLAGQATAGWAMYSLSPTNGLWVGQSFDLHWRYTRDRAFLEQRAYPWLSAVTEAVVELMEERDDRLRLPLSSSPEIHDNSLRAWLPPNSNYDQALIGWALGALAEMADELGAEAEADRWRALGSKLEPLVTDPEGGLAFARGEYYRRSHRHFSHAMAVHPLGTLNVDGGEADRRAVAATVERLLRHGGDWWVGYSYSWFACLAARAGRPELALDALRDYERAFTLRNGFHVNGDQTRSGLSKFQYRPFTLEGNFLAMEAVHEMLLQSWGGVVRVFPAVSERWREASFDRLRAQGGFEVSARRAGGRTAEVRIVATVDGSLKLLDPFGASGGRWQPEPVREGEFLVFPMRAGDSLEGSVAGG